MRRFVRPHRPDIGMVVTAGLLAFALLFALSVTTAVLTVSGGGGHPLIVAVYGFVVLVLLVGWRVYRIGIYVSDGALRIRHLLRTRTLRWSEIDQVSSRPARMLGRATVRHAIWVLPHQGRPVETPVQLEDEVMGPGRGAYPSRGRSEYGLRKNSGRLLGPREYEETLLLLRRRTAAAATRTR